MIRYDKCSAGPGPPVGYGDPKNGRLRPTLVAASRGIPGEFPGNVRVPAFLTGNVGEHGNIGVVPRSPHVPLPTYLVPAY